MVLDDIKIVDINKFRKQRKNKMHYKNGFMDFEETSHIVDCFLLIADIVEAMFMDIEDIIKQAGLNPAEFSLMPDSEKDFLSTNFYRFLKEQNQVIVLGYQATIDGFYYNASAYAVLDGDNAAVEGAICKCNDNITYLFNFNNGLWEECKEDEIDTMAKDGDFVHSYEN